MRINITNSNTSQFSYDIRTIVDIAKKIENIGIKIIWENIGDPVSKGEIVPEWIKEKVKQAVCQDDVYAYSPTKGLLVTREYISKERNLEGGVQITTDDILFFNGLGDAISKTYQCLNSGARIIGPNPAYPTHSSAEGIHAGQKHISYKLDPENFWQPDLNDLEGKIKINQDIAGILIINPNNPTGFVYPKDVIRKIVELAKVYKLFIISDEIYSNLAYNGSGMQKLASVIGDVPGISMRGISKEFPWPGSRCGWLEFYNRDKDKNFDDYVRSLINAKTLEVCSTTLPQKVLPEIMSDPRYYPFLANRIARYQERAKYVKKILANIPELIISEPQGAFYFTVVFKKGVLRFDQKLPLLPEAQKIIKLYLVETSLDQSFVYYLLAATGICVVPLSSGFNSDYLGFRFTLLEQDDICFEKTIQTIANSIRSYLDSYAISN